MGAVGQNLGKFSADLASLGNCWGKFALIQNGLGSFALAQTFEGALVSVYMTLGFELASDSEASVLKQHSPGIQH